MNSDQLRHFALVYDLRSYAAAARKIPMSAQGLTKSVRALERELGVTLFEPDPMSGAPVPTPYADELCEFVEVADSNLRLLRESFRRISRDSRYELRLGCSLGVMGTLGPEFLEGFRKTAPEVRVLYWETNDELCERGLTDCTYDLALSVEPAMGGAIFRPLYRCPVYFWVNTGDPLSRKRSLTFDDLAGHDVALPGEGFKCFDVLKRQTASRGVEIGRIYEMSEIFQLYEFASSGRGVGFTAGNHVRQSVFVSNPGVVAIPVEGATWGFDVEWLPTHALVDAERAFVNWCTLYCKRIEGNELAG